MSIPQVSLGDQWLGVFMSSIGSLSGLCLEEGGIVCLAQKGRTPLCRLVCRSCIGRPIQSE